METALRVRASAVILLMVANSLAWASLPNGQQAKTVINALNGTVPGNYVTLTQLAANLHAAAAAVTQLAHEANANGTTAHWDSEIQKHKSQFFGPINQQMLQALYKRAQGLGYVGGYGDFTKYANSISQKRKQAAWNHFETHGTYRMLLESGHALEKAAQNAARMAAENPNAIWNPELPIFCIHSTKWLQVSFWSEP